MIHLKDKEHCEEYGRMLQADPSKVSKRAKKRGLPQLGTLGAGNHYCEIQVIDCLHNQHNHRSFSTYMNEVKNYHYATFTTLMYKHTNHDM